MKPLELSEEQNRAIENIDGATLLLAVPGSGKTTTLVTRIGRMIYDFGIDPEKILVITFTTDAVEDLEKRFAQFYGSEYVDSIDFRTINSFCDGVVKKYASVAKRPKPELDKEQSKIIRKLFNSVYGDKFPDENEISNLETMITYIKNMRLSEREISELQSDGRRVKDMYDAYCKYMTDNHKMDYDDQLIFAYKIIKNNLAGLRDYYSDKYQYILVDEVQDTSKIQHEIIWLITLNFRNIFMVGDEDQSIYGFRAAYPEVLVQFANIYKGGRVLYLQKNYRSAKAIVDVASKTIRNNMNRYDKSMIAVRDSVGNLSVNIYKSRNDQYQAIIKSLGRDTETAILYRNNDSALPFIALLERMEIPYRCKKMDLYFFSNKVVKDAIDIINFAFNPASKDLIWNIYYKLDLRIRRKTLYDATQQLNYNERHPILEALCRSDDLGKSQKNKLEGLMTQLDLIRTGDNAKDAIHRIRKNIGYKNGSSEKLFILEAMAFKNEPIKHFKQRLRDLERKLSSEENQQSSNLILSTIHSSKGLEYDKVILVDAINDILPSPENDIEEERRIFYVAMTRAKNELTLVTYNDHKSLFINEATKPKPEKPKSGKTMSGKPKSGKTKPKQKSTSKRKPSKRKSSSRSDYRHSGQITRKGPIIRTPIGELQAGIEIVHKDYGTGTVTSIKKDIIKINFGWSVKEFLLPMVIEGNYIRLKR